MNRREFLASSATVAAAPMLLGMTHKASEDNPVIGEKAWKYECHHNWGKLPGELVWQTTHGTAIDSQGLIYITHQGAGKKQLDTVIAFDDKGKYVRSFGKEWHGGGHGIDIRKEGNTEFLYLCDVKHNIVTKTTLKGELVWAKGRPQEPGVYKDPAVKYSPTNVAFAPDGGFYIGDGYGSHYIHQYDKNAKWIRTWGGAGTAPGKMQTPHGLWLDDRPGRKPSLVVADRANFRLQYFTLDGKHLGFVDDVLFPAHFDIRGDVLLVPDLHARVSLFDKQNKPIVHLGDDATRIRADKKFTIRSDPKQWQPGKFVHPHDACFDRDGNIYVVEWVQTGRVTLLRKLA